MDVRMRGFRERADVDAVTATIDERVHALAAEVVEPGAATGRVLVGAVRSQLDVPPFDRSAMDGYAVRGADTFGATPYNPIELELVGSSMPAHGTTVEVGVGQAVRIMTGAPIPPGADAVVMAEHTRLVPAGEAGERVQVTEPVTPGRHLGSRGEDVRAGEEVLPAGRLLRPQDAGLLAATGHERIQVIRRPRVSILVSGDEVTEPGRERGRHEIFDANSPMLLGLVTRDGGIPDAPTRVRDDRDSLRSALQQLAASSDLVLVSGGSSVGTEDHMPTLVAELGELTVHGIALRPASPAGFGFVGGTPVFLLPGNPVSCLCAYDLLAGRALRRLGGRPAELPYRRSQATLDRKIASAIGRVDYVRVTLADGVARPIATSGASILSSTTRADGFVLVARDSEGVPPGGSVEVYLY